MRIADAAIRRTLIASGCLESRSRIRAHAHATAVAAWLLVRFHGLSSVRAGRLLGRHHTTILNAVARVDRDIRHGGQLQLLLEDTIDALIHYSKEIEQCAYTRSSKSSEPASASAGMP